MQSHEYEAAKIRCARPGALPFRALFLAVILIAAVVQNSSDTFQPQLGNELLTRDFPDAELVRPTDPPQSFNFETKRWSEWPPARPDVSVVIAPKRKPVIPKRK
jgi:hypothetical protein